jgi:hypothetical protein
MKLHTTAYLTIAMAALCLAGCTNDEDLGGNQTDYSLIGRAVNFEPTVDDVVTRANHDGFNERDVMYVYSQPYDGGNYANESSWVCYKLKYFYDNAGNVISRRWIVCTDSLKYRSTSKQTDADSISWESGKPMRFRAWAKSSIAGYKDYLYADYASVSGPVVSVQLQFKHLGCRVGFIPREANTIKDITLCTDASYYTDDADLNTGLSAEQKAANVQTIWNTICEPAGVQMYTSETSDNNGYAWGTTTDATSRDYLSGGLMAAPATGLTPVKGGDATPENTSRPRWRNLDSYFYSIFCPYRLDAENYGTPITLPPYTRFAVTLYDVNNGDVDGSTSGREARYHTFSLDELKLNGKQVYPNGMTLQSGYSYMFYAGYEYGVLTVTPSDNFAWTDVPLPSMTATDESAKAADADYTWWQDAMNTAAQYNWNLQNDGNDTNNDELHTPEYKISTVAQWKAFVNLVNGTLPEGGVKYDKFIPHDGQTPASLQTDAVLTSAYDFANEKITISADIDFMDEAITSAGTLEHPFRGSFDGTLHTFSNGNFEGGNIFGFIDNKLANDTTKIIKVNPKIGWLRITGTKNTTLVHNALNTRICAVYTTGPSKCAMGDYLTHDTIVGCAHVGTGTANGPLVLNGNTVWITSCFIAAAPNGYLFSGTNVAYWHCYYDKTLAPSTSYLGYAKNNNYFTQYYIRGVPSSVLKAKLDYNVGSYNYDLYYGMAPWKVLNGGNITTTGTHFEVPSRYNDQYPVMVSGNPSSEQYYNK